MLPKEVSQLIGKVGDVRVFEVEKEAIRRFADAIGDQNPLYYDEEYARNSSYGSIVAPPGFFGWPNKWEREGPFFSRTTVKLGAALAKAGYSMVAAIDAGIEYEFFCPVRAGDTLVASSRILDISERQGKTGKTVFTIIETNYTNQSGDLVAKSRWASIQR